MSLIQDLLRRLTTPAPVTPVRTVAPLLPEQFKAVSGGGSSSVNSPRNVW